MSISLQLFFVMNLWNVSFNGENETDFNSTLYRINPEQYDDNITNEENIFYPTTLVIPITVIYVIIFLTGLIGNVSTCIVISRNKSMHTATNYYLFSLAISDLLLLVSGLPPEMYRIWSPETYVFGEAFCILQGFAAETSANATVLTITAFTVERYLAICHPFLSHTMSKLSRAVKYVIVIWITALCLAAPQAIQFGVEYEQREDGLQRSRCTVVSTQFYFQHAFEISTFVFFVGPMTLITVLYVLIALKLRKSRLLSMQKRVPSLNSGNDESCTPRTSRSTAAQKRVIKMLVAVVVAFFICWAPFHAQRLLAVYLSSATPEDQEMFISVYIVLMYTSGVLYFLSTTVNPVLYHIMSKKFREAFKTTFSQLCRPNSSRRYDRKMYSSLLRHPQSFKSCKASSNAVEHVQPKNIPCFNKDFHPENQNNATLLKSQNNQSTMKETTLSGAAPPNGNFRPRIPSETSQTTVVTTLSKSLSIETKNESRRRGPLGRSVSTLQRQPLKLRHQGRNYLNRHKHGILSYGMFKLFSKQNVQNKSNFSRQGSVESARSTNTISNSSLQDMDESEFNSSELAQYMEEVNNELA